jgi:predicted transcriptional regulator of viral defense system
VTRRGATAAIILAYLRHERVMGQILTYMQQRHGVSKGATREQIKRLTQAGRIERIARGRYRRKG